MPHRILLQQSVYNTRRSVFLQIMMSVPSANMQCGHTFSGVSWRVYNHDGEEGRAVQIGPVIHRKEKTRRTCDIVLHLVSMQAGTCGKPLPFPHICIHTHGKMPRSLAYATMSFINLLHWIFWLTLYNTFDFSHSTTFKTYACLHRI